MSKFYLYATTISIPSIMMFEKIRGHENNAGELKANNTMLLLDYKLKSQYHTRTIYTVGGIS